MTQNTIYGIVVLAAFAMGMLNTFIKARFEYLQNVELIKRGMRPKDKRIPRHSLRLLSLSIPGQYSIVFGIFFLSLGLGFVISFLISGLWQNDHYMGGLAFSLASLLAGIGCIAHWKLTAAQRERALKFQEEMLRSQDFDRDAEPDRKPEEPGPA
ncbi:hypothetical protein LLH00_14335 [bacterium]|nr:hypothetical protein [bacterium]